MNPAYEPDRGCVVLDQPQRVGLQTRCGWSSTQPRSARPRSDLQFWGTRRAKKSGRSSSRSLPFIAALLMVLNHFAEGADQTAKTSESIRTVELRGRIVCLAEEMHQRHGAELPTKHEHLWALKTRDDKCYTLLRGKFSEAIFVDERIRQKELLVKARLFPGTQAIELAQLRSVKAGVVQDIFYYCDVCAIESVSPEICSCCQGPVELIERPLKDSAK